MSEKKESKYIEENIPPDRQQPFFRAIHDENLPRFYANGFLFGVGNGDLTVVFQRNGNSEMVVNLSLNIAKSLAIKIGNVINDIENGSKSNILISEEIDAALQRKTVAPKKK